MSEIVDSEALIMIGPGGWILGDGAEAGGDGGGSLEAAAEQ